MGATVTDPLVGRLVDGRYEIVSRIARGGMATVYLAVDRRLDRDVALKVMHPHLAEGTSGADFVARFRREARTAARLTHPGLVGVFDQGLDGETSYLTMEYVDGSNLRRRIAEQGALTVGETLRVTEAVLDALAAAHRVGLVHRDIKPENVLLASDDRVKLADFGLARAVTEVTSTTTGTVLGTVAYLAPELVVRGASDARTDVYACGILLYEMLVGAQPFTGETPIQVAFQHVNNDIPAPSDAVAWLPAEVDELVGALAARSPDDRPLDAAAALTLVRRTRASLDAATLARRADVAPSIALPAATDPDETDLDAEAQATDDVPTDETTRLPVPRPSGATVALPIGLGAAPPSAPVRVVDAAPPPRRRRVRVLAMLLVLLLALGGLGTWWYLRVGPGAWTTVPSVLQVTEDEAKAALDDAGLDASRVEAFDPTAPVGTVVASDPAVGERVRKEGVVELTVSKGPDYVNVPQGVVNELQANAEKTLADAGLEATYPPAEYHDTVPNGVVISATLPDGSPADPGVRSTRGTEVALVVSKGPAPVTVVSVVNEPLDAATATLDGLGLKVATNEAFSDTVEAGHVISQDPADKTVLHRGDTVTLTVSKGPELIEIPKLIGLQYDKAAEQLVALGMEPKRSNVLGGIFGTVRDQSVAGGQKVAKGTVITLTVV
ncbi:Stk1 family PASTA domain-containing Ser/Thr kinase [Cellulomonas sp. H30R-01]|uniref:Stk1 family PASTA domain-containing Ser/Thr kinase n=1 Tax=Cellulomonas sp. H30R-01 TaxID=2704467 RepID=UPI00138B610B|nr:Stk1 family PASTA domain-containing Ser/Thr kinase [Cellulomonas sp. H30R-01]QHT55971.1 Stk1 family PASTA domain-containing Ser/Thr kinase [Cellulomonas sp. H30R-01]